MSEENENKLKSPTHGIYYQKRTSDGEKSEWVKIGVSWIHENEEFHDITLNFLGEYVPLILRKRKPRS